MKINTNILTAWAEDVIQAESKYGNQPLKRLVKARCILHRLNFTEALKAPYGVQLQIARGEVLPEYLQWDPPADYKAWEDVKAADLTAIVRYFLEIKMDVDRKLFNIAGGAN